MNHRRSRRSHFSGPGHPILNQVTFQRALTIERKRADRADRPFVLLLIDFSHLDNGNGRADSVASDSIFSALCICLRETDFIGWYKEGTIGAAVLTELGDGAKKGSRWLCETVERRAAQTLSQALPEDLADSLQVAGYYYPEESNPNGPGDSNGPFYPDVNQPPTSKKASLTVKRIFDILVTSAALPLLVPLLLGIAVGVKLTSRGPVLFRQERIGRLGNRFTFFKFRSMYVNADPAPHKDYVTRFIEESRNGEAQSEELKQDGVFKLTRDPRVTPIGRFLRKTSLDELPQFLNVLKGEMSLVGPRPSIAYEVDCYHRWHRRRIMEVRPGITGLWQVNGRSRTTFDEMVRMDLRYARNWSLWLDLVLLLKTPWAVFKGEGAH